MSEWQFGGRGTAPHSKKIEVILIFVTARETFHFFRGIFSAGKFSLGGSLLTSCSLPILNLRVFCLWLKKDLPILRRGNSQAQVSTIESGGSALKSMAGEKKAFGEIKVLCLPYMQFYSSLAFISTVLWCTSCHSRTYLYLLLWCTSCSCYICVYEYMCVSVSVCMYVYIHIHLQIYTIYYIYVLYTHIRQLY